MESLILPNNFLKLQFVDCLIVINSARRRFLVNLVHQGGTTTYKISDDKIPQTPLKLRRSNKLIKK